MFKIRFSHSWLLNTHLKSRRFFLILAHPAKRGLVDSQFIYLLKMTSHYQTLREHCFYCCQTCHLFLRACLRGNSDANRRDFCHHRLSYKRCGYKMETLPQKPTGLQNVKRGIARMLVCTFSRVGQASTREALR